MAEGVLFVIFVKFMRFLKLDNNVKSTLIISEEIKEAKAAKVLIADFQGI